MDDLISRQAAIRAVNTALFPKINTAKDAEKALRDLPSAQPRPRGRWVKISPANIYECSQCGKNVMTDDISEYDFCHGCGADMREETHERL